MRTFHHLAGACITEGLVNSDGKVIKGTEVEKVILFNNKRYSLEEIVNMDSNKLYALEREGKIIIVDRFVANELSDQGDSSSEKKDINEDSDCEERK